MTINEIKELSSRLSTRIMEVKFVSPTNNHGDQVRIKDVHFNETKTINWDYRFNSALQVAINYLCNVVGIEIQSIAYNDHKDIYYIVTPFDAKRIK